MEWPSSIVYMKSFWVYILITRWHLIPCNISLKKASQSQKLNSFARIAFSLKFEKRKLLLNAFITSQFSYAPVVWMFHNRKLKNHANGIHKESLRVVFQYHNPTFEELLAKGSSFKIHDRNLRRLLIEIFKVKLELAPKLWMKFLTL